LSISPREYNRTRKPISSDVPFARFNLPGSYATIIKIIALASSVLTIFGVVVSRRRHMRLVCLFYRFFTQPHTTCRYFLDVIMLIAFIASSVSMLLAVQLYVAQTLSTDPSHLENAASNAYVGSRVRLTTHRPFFAVWTCSNFNTQNSVNRQLGIASVNAYKPIALLCFFVQVQNNLALCSCLFHQT
jgi:hypothetical protein